jgi:hypothetical protein
MALMPTASAVIASLMNPVLIFIFLFAFVVVAIAIAFQINKRARQRGAWSYDARRVLTDPEQVLFYRMREALPDCVVLAQVELSRVVQPGKGNTRIDVLSLTNRIRGKSLDYVVCLKDFTAIAAVELDEQTHQRKARRAADKTKQAALDSAGVPLLRWNVRALPSATEIRAALTRPPQTVD